MGRAMYRFLALSLLLLLSSALGGCEKTGPVEAKELARVVSRLEKRASARDAAEQRLSESSPYVTWKVLVPLIEKKSASGESRAAAIRAVARTQQDLGLPGAVVRATADPDASVRAEAIRAVVERADPEFSHALTNLAKAATDPDVKRDLEAAVAGVKARERDWFKSQLTGAPLPEERALAARSLSEIGQEPDVEALIAAAASPKNIGEQLFQQEVVLALSKIGGPKAQEFVRAQLTATNPFVRGISAFAETRLKDPAAVPDLEALLATEMVGDTRVSAATALGLIATAEARTALDKSCKLGTEDKRVELACAEARKVAVKTP